MFLSSSSSMHAKQDFSNSPFIVQIPLSSFSFFSSVLVNDLLYSADWTHGLESRTGLGKIAHNTVTPILELSHPFR